MDGDGKMDKKLLYETIDKKTKENYMQALKFEVVSNITDVGVTRIPHKWELHI